MKHDKKLRGDYFGYSVTCTVCAQKKKPVGRSAPIGSCFCDEECAGFYGDPLPSNLWPGESEADFGYPVSR